MSDHSDHLDHSIASTSTVGREALTGPQTNTVAGACCSSSMPDAEVRMDVLKQRRQALELQLTDRLQQLQQLCLHEAQLTGQLPAETPLWPGEPKPMIRRRVGTKFALPDTLLDRLKADENDSVASLEVDLATQRRIALATRKLANDQSLKKSIRKQHRLSQQLAEDTLCRVQKQLDAAKHQQKKANGEIRDSHLEAHATKSAAFDGKGPMCSTMPSPVREEEIGGLQDISAVSASSSPRKLRHCRQPPSPEQELRADSSDKASGGYVQSCAMRCSLYRRKQFPTLNNNSTQPQAY